MAGSLSDVQNPFDCSICLELFKDPVTTSCGHSFCMNCIEEFWDQESYKPVFSCPTCRNEFQQRPDLSRNIVLAGIVEERKQGVPAGPGDVQCDVCIGRKLKAVKSCLVCLASFCQAHVQPHYDSEAFKKHKLVNASANLQQQICPQHHKALEIYCCDDKKCICVLCMGQHSGHKIVSAAAEMAGKKVELKIKKTVLVQQINGINKQLLAFINATDSHKSSAQAAVESTDRVFNELIRSLMQKRNKVKAKIRAHEKSETDQINNYMQFWKQHIISLQRELDKLGQILNTEDHIHFFQNDSSHFSPPRIAHKEVNDLITFEKVEESVSELKNRLDELCEEHMAKISKKVTDVHIVQPFKGLFNVSSDDDSD